MSMDDERLIYLNLKLINLLKLFKITYENSVIIVPDVLAFSDEAVRGMST